MKGGVDTWRDWIGVETRFVREGMDAGGVEDLTSTGFFCGTGGEIRIRELFL